MLALLATVSHPQKTQPLPNPELLFEWFAIDVFSLLHTDTGQYSVFMLQEHSRSWFSKD